MSPCAIGQTGWTPLLNNRSASLRRLRLREITSKWWIYIFWNVSKIVLQWDSISNPVPAGALTTMGSPSWSRLSRIHKCNIALQGLDLAFSKFFALFLFSRLFLKSHKKVFFGLPFSSPSSSWYSVKVWFKYLHICGPRLRRWGLIWNISGFFSAILKLENKLWAEKNVKIILGISHCGHGEDEGASNNCSGLIIIICNDCLSFISFVDTFTHMFQIWPQSLALSKYSRFISMIQNVYDNWTREWF